MPAILPVPPKERLRLKADTEPKFATVVIESNGLFRDGLTRLLADTPFRVMASAPSLDAIHPMSLAEIRPALFFFGLGDGLEAAKRDIDLCKDRYPLVRRVVLKDHYNGDDVKVMVQAGVDACLVKAITTTTLLKSLDLVMLGETVFSTSVLRLMQQRIGGVDGPEKENSVQAEKDAPVSHRLSAREVDTLQCLLEGSSNKMIARKFDIAEATVKVHIKAILRKIRVANRTQAAIWAMNNLPQGSNRSSAVLDVGSHGTNGGLAMTMAAGNAIYAPSLTVVADH